MALDFSYRSSVYTTSGATSYTASPTWTPAANSLVYAYVLGTGGNDDPSGVTGHGLTYTKIASQGDGGGRVLTLWAANAGASPTSVACVASWGTARSGGAIIEFEATGWDNTGTVTAAFVQAPTSSGSGTSGSVTLAAAGHANNRPISGWWHLANEGTTPRTSWTEEVGADGGFNNPNSGVESQYREDAFETTASASWASSVGWVGIAAEVKAAVAGGAFSITAESGAFSIGGTAAGLMAARRVAADASAFNLSGTAASLVSGRRIGAELATFALTGTAATLTYTPVGGAFTLTADPGAYAIAGSAAALIANRLIAAESGVVSVAGTAAALRAARLLAAQATSYDLAGTDAALRAGRVLNALAAAFSITGTDAELLALGVGNPEILLLRAVIARAVHESTAISRLLQRFGAVDLAMQEAAAMQRSTAALGVIDRLVSEETER